MADGVTVLQFAAMKAAIVVLGLFWLVFLIYAAYFFFTILTSGHLSQSELPDAKDDHVPSA
jgi:hypothetical protein